MELVESIELSSLLETVSSELPEPLEPIAVSESAKLSELPDPIEPS